MACTWSILHWTRTLTRSAFRIHQIATAKSVAQPNRPLILTRLYSVLNRPVDVLTPAGRPLQALGANPFQQTARPLLPCNGTLIQPCRLKKRGMNYQPSNKKRKNKFGLHAKLKTKGGIHQIMRRMLKGRTLLTH